jgi:c-di-GMP-binding flagellar brake protein YcgR
MAVVLKEKRTTPRIQPYIVPCLLIDAAEERPLPGYLTDLSTRGARVACEGQAPEPGDALTLEFRIGRQVDSSRFKAVVKWVRRAAPGTRSVGLRFERVAAAEREALQALVEEFRQRVAEIGQG